MALDNMGSGLFGVAGNALLDGFNSSNPADKAMPYLQDAQETVEKYLSPYADMGQPAGDILGQQFGDMSQDPLGFLNKIMESYEPSQAYQTMFDRMSTAASNTAAAGGMRGSPREQMQQQELTRSLLGQDMQNFLNNVLGIQKTGLSGEQGLLGTGLQASTGLAGDISNILGTEGQLTFQGERENQQRQQDMLSSLLNMGGSILSLL